MFYYQHHIGDYRRDTGHLTLLEHGIYRQLLDHYYISEKPLDANAMRLVCVRTTDECEAYSRVLADFFIERDGVYFHNRCDHEIAKFKGKASKASSSAKVRWNKNNDLGIDANALRTHSEGNANQLTNKPTNQLKEKTSFVGFEIFWAAYPKRKSKGDAEKAFFKINPDDRLLSVILAAIDQAKTQEDWQKEKGKYIPYPASWLNAKGWQDEKTFVSVVKKVAI